MKRLTQVILIVTATCVSIAAYAQRNTQDLLRDIEISNRSAQLEFEQSRLILQQMEADTSRRQAEIERLRADTDRLRLWNESQEAADRAREIAERAREMAERTERAVLERADAAKKKADEAAEELRDEMEQAAVKATNNIYLGILLLFAMGFLAYVIRKSKRDEIMETNQKFGIAAIIGAALVTLLAIMISDDWVYKFDFVTNLMSSLRIKLFAEEGRYNAYFIDVPTKYVVLACICAAAYGLTTYLGITPLPMKKKAGEIQGSSTDATP